MKQTVDLYTFRDAFKSIRPDNFSREGLELLFNYLEEYEQDTDEEIELDVIAICCDWSESTAEEICTDFEHDPGLSPDDDKYLEAVLEWLQERTSVAGHTPDGGIVYCSF